MAPAAAISLSSVGGRKTGVSAIRYSTGAPQRCSTNSKSSAYFSGLKPSLNWVRSSGIKALSSWGAMALLNKIPPGSHKLPVCPASRGETANLARCKPVSSHWVTSKFTLRVRALLKFDTLVTFVVSKMPLLGYSFRTKLYPKETSLHDLEEL